MKILYLSGTGNNLYISKRIGGELLSIPQLIANNEYIIEDEVIGIVLPVYFWNAPNIVQEYLKKAEIKAEYIFAIVSYGTMYHATLNTIENILKKKGLELNYTNSVLMVDNYLPFFSMDKEISKKDNTSIDKKIDKIKKDIENKRINKLNTSFKAKFLTFIARFYSPLALKFLKVKVKSPENCNKCQICLRVCPKGNISFENDIPKIGNECIACLSCAQNCKQKVIKTPIEKDESRFLNPNIKVSEIIKSNNIKK